ncbi:MAG: heme biosynthesis protein HemY [Gammaproteobacteria bacterium]|jgi:HemY protein|nr:heme biosynthesis protein HemY [Gammaproteobacteria bacterium]
MIRGTTLLFVLVLAGIAAMAGYWLYTLEGTVEIAVPGTTTSLPLGLALLIGVLVAGLVAVAWWILAGVVTLPWTLGRARRGAKVKKANKALAEGLLAAEAGDAGAARKLAKRAARHADDDRLKLLLEARAAEAGENWSEAEKAWGQLMSLPGGQLAGLRGAASAAIERGDASGAEKRARAALELKSGAEWPFNSLFDIQVNQGRWDAALSTLASGEKRGLISGESLRRRRAVLLTAHAAGLGGEHRSDAQRALADAIRGAPGFPPAAWHGARHLMVDGKVKPAQNVLELAWKSRPHPALAELAGRLVPDENAGETRKRLESLVNANPGHRESRILKSEIAMESEEWLAAIRELALLIEEKPTARLCLLMETALKGYGDPGEAERWARMAMTAAREADWSDIDPRGNAFDFEVKDWSRLVYAFGDAGELVHPRHEAFARELAAGGARKALPSPSDIAPPTVPQPKRAGEAPPDFADAAEEG